MKMKNRYNRFAVHVRRFFSSLRSTMNHRIPSDGIQEYAFRICKRMITHPDSELIHAPLSSTFYVENAHYYIRFSSGAVTITNGKFSYYVWLPESMTDQLKSIFNRISQSRSNRLETRYAESILHNLKEISSSLENA